VETSSVVSAVPSSLGHLRSVTKDALGTHVQTEQYTMHIEEVRKVLQLLNPCVWAHSCMVYKAMRLDVSVTHPQHLRDQLTELASCSLCSWD
jgi:hypothetical protein